ncbi:uncharacterized protein J7T54_001187 [Emericellopsis cladophorae]|uniref:BZIP domain-containing protein n=1 Tax=Emericellopsis cladophorae TaxID=2686198 RepID=A0A9P9Y001_9HYPO|nr:uncharacterized protein J7T54_001187 [Emericellopsis cladophorae]KAI6780683.1 hypothetical protein J7T54_001187 [Emericellopsis cladophorae]
MFKNILSVAALVSSVLAAPTPTTGGNHPTRADTPLTGVTHTVVAGQGGLNFEPANVVAQVGDIIQWDFLPANHSVVQSNFADPCQPLADGSGFFPGFEFATQEGKNDNVFQIVIEDDSTIWYYCPQLKGEHCKKGMVGVINQDFDSNERTLAKHKELAAGVEEIVVPSGTQGGEILNASIAMDVPRVSEGGDMSAPMSEQEKKKLRNRLSQRAFRRRQAECVRELQSRVQADQRPESERVEALQKENRMLRQQLVDLQSNMSRMMATMQSLNDSVTKTLDSTAHGDEALVRRDTNCQTDMVPIERINHRPASDQPPSDLNSFDLTATELESLPGQTGCLEPAAETSGTWFDLVNPGGTSPLYSQIPNIWSHEYQMGMQPYLAAVNATEESRMMLGKHYPCTNSPFSDHIQLLQHMLKNKLDASGSIQSVYQPVLMVLSMFNSMTRPDVMAWYAKTRFFHIIELTAWQLYPSSSTFEKLHPRYRPIKAQMENAHPLIIDWIPFPSVRDRLIQLHSANPHVDQIFCDAVTGYVVETLMSDLVLGAEPVQVYVRVTDLINTMASVTAENDETVAVLPAPDVASLFSSPAYARAAFNKLNMDKGAGYYKIDPAFFGKYPELYDQASELTAAGTPLKPTFQKILTYPKPLSHSTVETYRSFIDFSLDAINMIIQSPGSGSELRSR